MAEPKKLKNKGLVAIAPTLIASLEKINKKFKSKMIKCKSVKYLANSGSSLQAPALGSTLIATLIAKNGKVKGRYEWTDITVWKCVGRNMLGHILHYTRRHTLFFVFPSWTFYIRHDPSYLLI